MPLAPNTDRDGSTPGAGALFPTVQRASAWLQGMSLTEWHQGLGKDLFVVPKVQLLEHSKSFHLRRSQNLNQQRCQGPNSEPITPLGTAPSARKKITPPCTQILYLPPPRLPTPEPDSSPNLSLGTCGFEDDIVHTVPQIDPHIR